MSTSEHSQTSLAPREGWHVMHLFYHLDHSQWGLMSPEDQRKAKTQLTELVQEIRAHKDTQLITTAVATPKADIGFILLTPDLSDAIKFEKRLTLSLGADVLTPTYSYLSQTEKSEYTTTLEQYTAETLIAEKNLTPDTPEFEQGVADFHKHIEHYVKFRLYPVLPAWPVICFYPMSKRRTGNDNWFSLDFDTRRKLMKTHAVTGRKYSGRILQMITGSTGLDEHEWGVTLLAKDSADVKAIVYEMRFDEVSARYAEFGDFFLCTQLQLDELFRQICL